MQDKKEWTLGEPCFIADLSLTPGHVRMRIMPAVVINPKAPMAQTLNPSAPYGRWTTEGTPFPTEELARAWLQSYVTEIVGASAHIPYVGARPEWEVPKHAPRLGQVVYCIDDEAKEVLEVVIGFLSFEHGFLEVGYDSSPGNSEASHVRLKEWWLSKEEAMLAARERHGEEFSFLTKEEVAERTDKRIKEVWQGAEARLSSPEHRVMLEQLKRVAKTGPSAPA